MPPVSTPTERTSPAKRAGVSLEQRRVAEGKIYDTCKAAQQARAGSDRLVPLSSYGKRAAAVWQALPNSKFKRFQELFSAREDWVVPAFEEGAQRVTFAADPKRLSVAGCIVDPRRIPDELVKSLGLTSFSDSLRKPLARLQAKAYPSVTEGLKAIWDASLELDQRNLRVLIVAQPSPEVMQRFPNAALPAQRALGSVLYTSENSERQQGTSERLAFRELQIAYYRSAYDARRKTAHQAAVYESETALLTGIENRVSDLVRRVNSEWKTETPESEKERLRAAAQSEITRDLEILKRCVNRFKKRAADLFETVGDLTDKLGRDNPSAALAKISTAAGNLKRRVGELFPRGGYNKQDEMMLHRCIEEQLGKISGYLKAVDDRAALKTLDLPISLFAGSVENESAKHREIAGLKSRLGIRAGWLQGITAKPFVDYARELQRAEQQFDVALWNGERDQAKRALIKFDVIGRLSAAGAQIELMKLVLAREPVANPAKLQAIAGGAIKALSRALIFQSTEADALRHPVVELSGEIQRISSRLTEYSRGSLNETQAIAMGKKLKAHLDLINVAEIVRELPHEFAANAAKGSARSA